MTRHGIYGDRQSKTTVYSYNLLQTDGTMSGTARPVHAGLYLQPSLKEKVGSKVSSLWENPEDRNKFRRNLLKVDSLFRRTQLRGDL